MNGSKCLLTFQDIFDNRDLNTLHQEDTSLETGEFISAKSSAIYAAILQLSPTLRTGNFASLAKPDLTYIFQLYDRFFFDGTLTQKLSSIGSPALTFRLSPTMSKAAGKTTVCRRKLPDGSYRLSYEIGIAWRILFMNFKTGQRPVTVCGLVCMDRLQTLQRIMEHEIIHLYELLESGRSSCASPAFKSLAGKIFGHLQTSHTLLSTHELAATEHAIHLGSMVEFEFQGRRMRGRVNRIHHRATVLVNAPDGLLYSDGQRYHKFYIPLPLLRPMVEDIRLNKQLPSPGLEQSQSNFPV